MQDQVKIFSEKGLKAGCVTKHSNTEVRRIVKEGGYQLVFFSPEAVVSTPKWRSVLQSKVYQDNVVALVIDEAHCIYKW